MYTGISSEYGGQQFRPMNAKILKVYLNEEIKHLWKQNYENSEGEESSKTLISIFPSMTTSPYLSYLTQAQADHGYFGSFLAEYRCWVTNCCPCDETAHQFFFTNALTKLKSLHFYEEVVRKLWETGKPLRGENEKETQGGKLNRNLSKT